MAAPEPPRRGGSDLASALGMAVSVGVPFGVLVSSGAFAGHYFDARWNTGPWLTLVGIALGAVAAFVNMFRVLSWWERRQSGGRTPDDR